MEEKGACGEKYLTRAHLCAKIYGYAPVAELADAQDLGSCVNSCRFKSCWAHQKSTGIACRFFIHCESNGISSRDSVYIIAEGVYHQPQAVFLSQ